MSFATTTRQGFHDSKMFTASMTILLAIAVSNVANAQTTAKVGALKDNTLYFSSTGAFSNGAGEHFFAGATNTSDIRRGLIAFNIASSVPAGATVTAVALTLHMSRSQPGTRIVQLRRVLADWGEGASNALQEEGAGTTPATGDATWIHRFFNTSLWTTPGGDFSATISATSSIGDTGSYTWTSTAQMVGDVQGWLNTPANNFGWILIGAESTAAASKRFDAHEIATVAFRPSLSVTYTTTSGVGQAETVPAIFSLAQNYPNPFNPSSVIGYQLPVGGHVTLKVYDALGRNVAKLIDEHQSEGSHTVQWDASGFASGIYFYRLALSGEGVTVSSMKKMMLIK